MIPKNLYTQFLAQQLCRVRRLVAPAIFSWVLVTLLTVSSVQAQQTVVPNLLDSELLILDLSTGERSLLSSSSQGDGQVFSSPAGMTRDANGNILVSEDLNPATLYSIDTADGDRTVISGSGVGSGPDLSSIVGLAVEADGNIVAASISRAQLIRIDPSTGKRTVLSDATTGGASIARPWGILVDSDGSIIFADYGTDAVMRVDPTTGVRTIISSSVDATAKGTGPDLDSPTGIVKTSDGSLVVLNRFSQDYLIKIDPATGNRTLISGVANDNEAGTGPTISARSGLSIDSDGMLYVADFDGNAIVKVDPNTGNRTTIANNDGAGSGPAILRPLGILSGAVTSVSGPSEPGAPTSASASAGDGQASVSFTAPADDGGASITGYTVTSSPEGLTGNGASSPISVTGLTNGTAYTFTVTATNSAGAGAASGPSTAVTPIGDQTITFENPGAQSYADGSLSLGATASSSLDVSYSVVSGPANVSGSTLTFTGAGSVTVRASQAGDSTYNPAPNVEQTFAINKLSQTITFENPGAQSYADGSLSLGATASSSLDVSYSVVSGPANVSGSTLTFTGAGSVTVRASQAGDSTYNPAPNVEQSFAINKLSQTITFVAPQAVTVNQSISLAATASSGLSVTYQVISGDATLSGSSLTIDSAASSIAVRASQAGNETYDSASKDISIDLSAITKLEQTFDLSAFGDKQVNDGAFELPATSSSGLPISYSVVSGPASIDGNAVTLTGAEGTVVIRAEQTGNDMYGETSDTLTFSVAQVGPVVYFGSTSEGLDIAAVLPEDSDSGTLMGQLSENGPYFILTFELNENRSITPTSLELIESASQIAESSSGNSFSIQSELEYSFSGTIENGMIDIAVAELGITLTGTVEPAEGSTKELAGFYKTSSLNAASGDSTVIMGTTGKFYALVDTPNFVSGKKGADIVDGAFALTMENDVIIQGSIDATTKTVAGSIVMPNGDEDEFAGLANSAARTDRLINHSTRGRVSLDGSGAFITGFVIGGDSDKQVLIRGVGPGLSSYSINDILEDPRIQLYDSSATLLMENDNWGDATELKDTMARVGAFPLEDSSLDSAMLATLAPGPYTVHILGNGDSGIALAEIYDASTNPNVESQRLVNISSRGKVTEGEGVLIDGFVVTGNSPKKVLIRGIGPGLEQHGVSQFLQDPVIKLYDVSGTQLAQNDDWGTGQPLDLTQAVATGAEIEAANTSVGAFQLEDGSADSASVITLAPGVYTVHLYSTTNDTGNALIEVYEMP